MLKPLKYKVFSAVVLLLLGAFAHVLPAAAQVTSLSMQSDAGDYIGQGQTYLYTPADGPFIAFVGDNNSINISFNTPTFDHFWSLISPPPTALC